MATSQAQCADHAYNPPQGGQGRRTDPNSRREPQFDSGHKVTCRLFGHKGEDTQHGSWDPAAGQTVLQGTVTVSPPLNDLPAVPPNSFPQTGEGGTEISYLHAFC